MISWPLPTVELGVEENESQIKKSGVALLGLADGFRIRKFDMKNPSKRERSNLSRNDSFFFVRPDDSREESRFFFLGGGVKIAILEASGLKNSGSEGFARVDVSFFIVGWHGSQIWGSLKNGVSQNDTCKWETLAKGPTSFIK